MKDRNKGIVLFLLGAISALFVLEARKEKPFEGLKARFRRLMEKLKMG